MQPTTQSAAQSPFASHLQQVLAYLKQGHPVLPAQPMTVPAPTAPTPIAPTMPAQAPPPHLMR